MVAQLVERWTVVLNINPSVTGSIPVRENVFFYEHLVILSHRSSVGNREFMNRSAAGSIPVREIPFLK